MADHEYIVLSKPPEGVSGQEFNDWYDRHMREILELPGFVSAQRSALTLRGARGDAFELRVPRSLWHRRRPRGDAGRAARAVRAAGSTSPTGLRAFAPRDSRCGRSPRRSRRPPESIGHRTRLADGTGPRRAQFGTRPVALEKFGSTVESSGLTPLIAPSVRARIAAAYCCGWAPQVPEPPLERSPANVMSATSAGCITQSSSGYSVWVFSLGAGPSRGWPMASGRGEDVRGDRPRAEHRDADRRTRASSSSR